MKNAVILHGAGSTPNSFWHPYLKKELEKLGYSVWVPKLPNTDNPDLKNWLPFVMGGAKFNKETVLVGHSAGSALILVILENLKVKIKKAILVAGFSRPDNKNTVKEPILQKTYNWEKIKNNVDEIVFVNSDNDPWGCNDVEGKYMADHLGGTLIIKYGSGHMGSDKFKQPYKNFPCFLN